MNAKITRKCRLVIAPLLSAGVFFIATSARSAEPTAQARCAIQVSDGEYELPAGWTLVPGKSAGLTAERAGDQQVLRGYEQPTKDTLFAYNVELEGAGFRQVLLVPEEAANEVDERTWPACLAISVTAAGQSLPSRRKSKGAAFAAADDPPDPAEPAPPDAPPDADDLNKDATWYFLTEESGEKALSVPMPVGEGEYCSEKKGGCHGARQV